MDSAYQVAPPCKAAIPSRGVKIRLSEKAVYPIAGDQEATLRMGHDELARRSVVLHCVVFFRKRTSILGGRNCINQQSQQIVYISAELSDCVGSM